MNKVKIEGSLAVKEKKVIVIEAASHREEDKLRVAAYIRVSSDSADQLNSFMAKQIIMNQKSIRMINGG